MLICCIWWLGRWWAYIAISNPAATSMIRPVLFLPKSDQVTTQSIRILKSDDKSTMTSKKSKYVMKGIFKFWILTSLLFGSINLHRNSLKILIHGFIWRAFLLKQPGPFVIYIYITFTIHVWSFVNLLPHLKIITFTISVTGSDQAKLGLSLLVLDHEPTFGFGSYWGAIFSFVYDQYLAINLNDDQNA